MEISESNIMNNSGKNRRFKPLFSLDKNLHKAYN